VDPDGRLPVLVVPVIAFLAKELAGEAFEQATGLPAPTVKNAGKYAVKQAVEATAKDAVGESAEKVGKAIGGRWHHLQSSRNCDTFRQTICRTPQQA